MNRIRLLPEQVANQIAAGEVVERPASIVKELVENSLDAGARQVTVEIQAGGRSLVRVLDDGVGMSRDDALLCLERHATSKIRRAEDLASVATMGFRGEALPSIASVSRFTLTTRERDGENPEGTEVIVNGGKIQEVKAAGCAPGTAIEVRQLFFNLPARRKFLRSEETESAHIQHYLTLAALAYPEVGFSFQKDGRQVWHLPAVKASNAPDTKFAGLAERLRALYGSEQKLLQVDYEGVMQEWRPGAAPSSDESLNIEAGQPDPSEKIRIWGFIGSPGVSRSTREDQHIFVNRRPVENRGINYALLEGYHTALMKGRYPVCCLFIEIDPAAVDVNIHPAKREVKFHREGEVRRQVSEAVKQTLLGFATLPTAPARPPAPAPVRPQPAVEAGNTQEPPLPNFPAEFQAQRPTAPLAAQVSLGLGFQKPSQPQCPGPLSSPAEQASMPSAAMQQPGAETAVSLEPPRPQAAQGLSPVPLLSVPLRLIGVVGRLYVLLESDRGLVLVDQHAAHERILFEQMLTRLEQKEQAPSQRLLLPETVELSSRDAVFIQQQLPTLTRLGVGLSEFGERTFLLDALPPFVRVSNPRRFILELVDELKAAGQQVNSLRLGEHTVAKTVCRHAVKANDPLGGAELDKLVENLKRCAMPYTCPHGRPTIIEMNYRELEKKFGRTA